MTTIRLIQKVGSATAHTIVAAFSPRMGLFTTLIFVCCKLASSNRSAITTLEKSTQYWKFLSRQGRRQKIFQGGPIRIEPVLTSKNEGIFELWEVLERVCENPEGTMALPCPLPPLPTHM